LAGAGAPRTILPRDRSSIMSMAHCALLALLTPLPTAPEQAPPQDPFAAWATAALAREGLNPWKREAIEAALARPYTIRTATCTSYCSSCHDWPKLETSTEPGLHRYCAAADRRYWRLAPHRQRVAVVWVDIPRAWGGPRLLTLNDVGGAIKGRDRFDLCQGMVSECRCESWGVRRGVRYVALRGAK
jgi:3D (Asp-Asp-Asp) domain-containing protein